MSRTILIAALTALVATPAIAADRQSAPAKESSTFSILLFWIVLAFASYKAVDWWQGKQQRERAARNTAVAAAFEAGREAQARQQRLAVPSSC